MKAPSDPVVSPRSRRAPPLAPRRLAGPPFHPRLAARPVRPARRPGRLGGVGQAAAGRPAGIGDFRDTRNARRLVRPAGHAAVGHGPGVLGGPLLTPAAVMVRGWSAGLAPAAAPHAFSSDGLRAPGLPQEPPAPAALSGDGRRTARRGDFRRLALRLLRYFLGGRPVRDGGRPVRRPFGRRLAQMPVGAALDSHQPPDAPASPGAGGGSAGATGDAAPAMPAPALTGALSSVPPRARGPGLRRPIVPGGPVPRAGRGDPGGGDARRPIGRLDPCRRRRGERGPRRLGGGLPAGLRPHATGLRAEPGSNRPFG